jgi:transcriptional regulator with XRE-family HTH domain
MTRRGWDAVDLARAARLSPATVSTALAGKPISAHSMSQIAKALSQAPVDELIDRLIKKRDSPDLGFA